METTMTELLIEELQRQTLVLVKIQRIMEDVCEQLKELNDNEAKTTYLTSQKAAQYLGIHRKTLYRWISNGKVAAAKRRDGEKDRYLIKKADIVDLISTDKF